MSYPNEIDWSWYARRSCNSYVPANFWQSELTSFISCKENDRWRSSLPIDIVNVWLVRKVKVKPELSTDFLIAKDCANSINLFKEEQKKHKVLELKSQKKPFKTSNNPQVWIWIESSQILIEAKVHGLHIVKKNVRYFTPIELTTDLPRKSESHRIARIFKAPSQITECGWDASCLLTGWIY